jgi:WD40 repeat protein
VGTLRLLDNVAPTQGHNGEVFSCAYSADGGFVLSGGWDGYLRLWDSSSGAPLACLPASPKPLSACAFHPDGKQWLSGSMEGLLTFWDGVSHQSLFSFVAHTRPISAITFAPEGEVVATASWDRLITLRKVGREREGRNLSGHLDIVAGCRFTVDGKHLLSWSHDGTLKVWALDLGTELYELEGHKDRVTTAALSPDGRYALSGSRDGTLRLWDLPKRTTLGSVQLGPEVRACFFLLDGESVVAADAGGRLVLMTVPGFAVQAQVQAPYKALCGELAPSGTQLVLGGEDGRVHLVGIDGLEEASLVVTATQAYKEEATLFGRLLGTTRRTRTYQYTCPACRQTVQAAKLPTEPVACPRCRRRLRVNPRAPLLQGL